MMSGRSLLLLALAVILTVVAAAQEKFVFAHFIAGNGVHMSPADWASDLALAKAAKIDGFAVNVAAGDPNTDSVLAAAYAAAEIAGDFKMFLSFDYLSMGAWDAAHVTNKINQYKSSPAQFNYQGKPLVSTFEGVGNTGDWAGIKSATGCFFVPDWSSLGPKGFAHHLYTVDGAFSWDAWPEGAADKTAEADEAWMKMLGKKTFMMPVSPWFYTNMPNWDKNWLWRGDDLWSDRWQDVVRLQPPLVEILSWNDFGESHYIGPIHPGGVPDGAEYVANMPHEAWLKFLPHYIAAYKSGNTTMTTTSPDAAGDEAITYWYKLNPGDSGLTGGTTGNNPNQGQPAIPPQLVSQDKVFVSVLVARPSTVSITIGHGSGGGGGQPTLLRANSRGINHFSVPIRGQVGAVRIAVEREGREIVATVGPEITHTCRNGRVNWNAYVGSS